MLRRRYVRWQEPAHGERSAPHALAPAIGRNDDVTYVPNGENGPLFYRGLRLYLPSLRSGCDDYQRVHTVLDLFSFALRFYIPFTKLLGGVNDDSESAQTTRSRFDFRMPGVGITVTCPGERDYGWYGHGHFGRGCS